MFSAFLSPHSEWNPSACFVYWPCSLLYLVCPVAAALGSQDPAHQPLAQAGSMSPIPWGFVLGTRESTVSVCGDRWRSVTFSSIWKTSLWREREWTWLGAEMGEGERHAGVHLSRLSRS